MSTTTIAPSGGDDTSRIQRMVSNSQPGDVLLFAPGNYRVSSTLNWAADRRYFGQNATLNWAGGIPGGDGPELIRLFGGSLHRDHRLHLHRRSGPSRKGQRPVGA